MPPPNTTQVSGLVISGRVHNIITINDKEIIGKFGKGGATPSARVLSFCCTPLFLQ